MNNKNIIILSSDDWGWKTSKYQLATRFARDNKVLFVSSVGFRAPSVNKQDVFRILKKLLNFVKGVQSISHSLFVFTPLVIPFNTIPLVSKINNTILKIQIEYVMRKLDMNLPYLFVFSQNWLDLVKQITCNKIIYYCVDEHSGFKGIDSNRFKDNDEVMSRLADIIICSSRKLQSQKKELNDSTYYIPHGVNYKLFSRAVHDTSLMLPADVNNSIHPILGFFGHISYDWVDASLLKYIAAARPGWKILLIGRNSMLPDEFCAFENIHLLGEREYDDLPAYCKVFTVAIIPFVKSLLTNNCNPLKLYEYLSAGLPVVSTDIPEVREHANVVSVAETYEDFLESCELALQDDSVENRKTRSSYMSHSSWEDKIDEIYKILAV